MPRGRGRRPSDGWEIEQTPEGLWDLRLDRRAVQYDCDDIAEAVRLIRRQDPAATEAEVIEVDGYRRTVDLETLSRLS